MYLRKNQFSNSYYENVVVDDKTMPSNKKNKEIQKNKHIISLALIIIKSKKKLFNKMKVIIKDTKTK